MGYGVGQLVAVVERWGLGAVTALDGFDWGAHLIASFTIHNTGPVSGDYSTSHSADDQKVAVCRARGHACPLSPAAPTQCVSNIASKSTVSARAISSPFLDRGRGFRDEQ